MNERDDFPIESMTGGLGFPEGQLALADGSILVCDVHGGLVRRILDGRVETLADLGGAPNGLALGPAGWVYVANNGGNMRWDRQGDLLLAKGYHPDGDARIERVHVDTGRVERVLDRVGGQRLEAIDDLVFDPRGGFWFTDLGRDGPRSRTYGGVYWYSADGRDSREVVYPLASGANGIALSPDDSTLYVTEYGAGRLWAWTVEGPGRLHRADGHAHGGRLLWQAPDAQLMDSLAITAAGNLVVAMQPCGDFCVVSPHGALLATVGMPDRFPTNLCFDPRDPTRAYATLSSSGRLASVRWNERGHVPAPGAADRPPDLGTGAHPA